MDDSRTTLLSRMQSLYREELQQAPDRAYLFEHASPASIARQVDVFQRYRSFLPQTGRVLDWGCHHAPDASMIREALGEAVTLCEAVRMLRHHGFHPLLVRYHQLLPAHRLQALFAPLWPVNGLLERVWPLRLLCANLMIVAQRRSVM